MERVRKWMSILAIAGTVLVTAVFCYMPVREVLKEKNRKVISLEEENTLGETGEQTEALQEAMEEKPTPEEEGNSEEGEGQEESRDEKLLSHVVFGVGSSEEKMEIKLWQSGEGLCYLFLPGFAKEERIVVEEAGEGGFAIGSRHFGEGDAIEGVKWEEAYEFVLYDKENNPLLQAPLFFVCSSEIPAVMLATESGSMEWIESEKGNEEAGEITVYDGTGVLLYDGEAESISGRGNSTWGLLKKPYRFELREGADLFGFGKAKDWNLLAEGYDQTKLRNRIAMGLADELAMAYTPKRVSVDVYCNGVYQGIYLLCEVVQVDEQRVDIKDMEANFDAVYTQTELQELELFSSEDGSRRWTSSQVQESDITGGYLLERELDTRFKEESSGFITRQGDAYALQSPKYATREQVDYIAALMQEFQDAIEEKDGRNQETGKHYSEYIDVESFAQKYLIEEISKNYDGGVTSSFFYKPDDSVSTRIHAGPVWDYDVSFGNCNLDDMVSNPMGITKLNDHVWGTEVFARLYEQEDFYDRVVALYEEKALPYLDWLLAEGIDTLSGQLLQAVKADGLRWEALENRYRYYENYENDIRYLKYFIRERRDFLSQVWLQGVTYHCLTFMTDGEAWKKVYVRDGALPGAAPVPAGQNAVFVEWQTTEHSVPYDEYKPVYEDMSFVPIWQELPASVPVS